MKVEFRRATLSPSGDHFSTSNNFWDASDCNVTKVCDRLIEFDSVPDDCVVSSSDTLVVIYVSGSCVLQANVRLAGNFVLRHFAEIRQGDSMSTKRKHHSAEQIVKKLRDAETMLHAGKTVAEVVQTLAVSEQT